MLYDVSLQTIAWINELNNHDSLQINPDFQRRAVWLEEERSKLMDTIIKNLPFPEVYFQIQTDSGTGRQKYVVVDGQQRVTSILMFINNEFQLFNTDKYFRDLEDDEKDKFWNYQVVVRNLKMTNDLEIRDLFQKLNTNNVVLNDQELRNARYIGKYKQLCERLSDTPFFQSIGLFTPRDIRRMLDIEYVSELVLQMIYGVTNKKDLLDTAYLKFEEDLPDESSIEDKFNDIVTILKTFISDENRMLIKTKTNFYSLFGAVLQTYNEGIALKTSGIQEIIGEFLLKVRDESEGSSDAMVRNYAEAYNRASSDKSRRVSRQDILFNLLKE